MSRQVADILRERLYLKKAYRQVFSTEDGKIVLRHLMRTCFITSPTFIAGDPQSTAMNEGSRRVVLSILKFLKMDEKELLKQIEQETQNEN